VDKFKATVKSILLFVTGIALFISVIVFSDVGIDEIIRKSTSISILPLLGIIVLTAIVFLITAEKWKSIIYDQTGARDFGRGFFFYYSALGITSGFFVSQNLSSLGVRSLSLKINKNIPLSAGAYSVLLDQLMDLFILFLFIIPSTMFLTGKFEMKELAMAMALLSMISFAAFSVKPLFIYNIILFSYEKLIEIACTMTSRKNRPSFLTMDTESKTISASTGKKLYYLSLLKFLVLVTRSYFVALAFNIDISLLLLLICAPTIFIAGLIGFTPGSLGILEWGWFGILVFSGVSNQDAASFIIFQRFAFLLSSILILSLSYFYYRKYDNAEAV